jgi:hypothetical protein
LVGEVVRTKTLTEEGILLIAESRALSKKSINLVALSIATRKRGKQDFTQKKALVEKSETQIYHFIPRPDEKKRGEWWIK